MHPIYPDHVVDISQLFKMLAQRMQSLCQLRTLFFNLPGRLDDLLVQYLIAIREVGHASAEDHRI